MDETVFQWKKTDEGGACILGGYGASPFVVVPEKIDGVVVTEIGDYCFSQSGNKEQQERPSSFQRELSGEFIENVYLPDSVKKLGNLAFYNCTRLKELQIGAGLTQIGSDAFMNCLQLSTIRLRCSVAQNSGIKQLLSQRSADTTVIFEDGGQTEAVVMYPEYYEMYDEIGPAHIFALNLTGEGFRARQCFEKGIVDLAKYDAIFEQACAEESPKTLCEMAVNRLCYPAGLSREAESRYRNYVHEQEDLLVKNLVKNRNLELLEILFSKKILTSRGREKSIALASGEGWPEGAASLLFWNQGLREQRKDRYSFEDF